MPSRSARRQTSTPRPGPPTRQPRWGGGCRERSRAMADRALARKVLRTEAAAILALIDRVDERSDRAIDLLRACRGRVILTGIGKSGIICRKIAATLSSTGTPAFFLHPEDA